MTATQSTPATLHYDAGVLVLLDQRQLPQRETFLDCRTVADVCAAIRTLAVRGAPAIGMAAAYGLLLDYPHHLADPLAELSKRAAQLKSCRPTAVNLAWAVDRMLDAAVPGADLYGRLEAQARQIQAEDELACQQIGTHGRPLIETGPRLLTHCNAGALAVSRYGTALAPIYAAHTAGVDVHVFVDETRPLLQGARLTAYELSRAGVSCTLISDNMAAAMMAQGEVDQVIVGADRVAANGDVANKIGTLGVAIVAAHFGLPFYVACPRSTFDAATASGDLIAIEERHADEVAFMAGQRIAADVAVRNPAFDVTPAALVTGIITEDGVFAPDKMQEYYGS